MFQNTPTEQQFPTTLDDNGLAVTSEVINGTGEHQEPVENGTGNGTASWAGSVAGDPELSYEDEQQPQQNYQEPQLSEDTQNYPENNVADDFPNEPSLETVLAQQLHVSHHVVPPVPQPYMYPGHYMFGPALINVNGSLSMSSYDALH